MMAVAFLVVHVVTLLLDPQSELKLVDLVLPFDATYRPLWMGLGTVGLDLMAAVFVTSLLRQRIGVRAWRAVHWLAYLSWPVAILHTVGTGTDRSTWWLLALTGLCDRAPSPAAGSGGWATDFGRPRDRTGRPVPAPAPNGADRGGRRDDRPDRADRRRRPDASRAARVDRLRGASAPDLATHLARLGPLPGPRQPRRVVADGAGGRADRSRRRRLPDLAQAGSRCRRAQSGRRRQRAEGEPASRKDRTLLQHAPHLVLDGLQVAAAAVGATVGVRLRARVGATPASAAPWPSASDRRAASSSSRRPESFVSGQETAVVAAIEGAPPVPRDVPDLVVRRGVRGRPTLVQNVETLAHLALIARRGADWFRAVGTAEQPGTFLATVSGAVRRPGRPGSGVRRAPWPTCISRAGGATEPLQAVLVGGYHGVWLPADALEAPMSPRGAGALGCHARGRRRRGPRPLGVRAGGDGPDRGVPGR